MAAKSILMRVRGLATGASLATPTWVASYDVDDDLANASVNFDGTITLRGAWGGSICLTHDRAAAQRFHDVSAAVQAWNTQSAACPLRPDGRPNKPLTALTVEFEPEALP